MFNSDTPINNIDEDLLDRGKFAQNVADAIKSYSNHESLAIGIYGGWGEGKSSLANMILSKIPNKNGETNCVVINFNPWLYSNTEELITELFKEISCVFNFSDINEINKKTANAIEKVGQGAKAARYLPIPVVKDIADIISNLFEDYANFLKGNEKDKTLKEIKDKIDNELRKNKIRLIITIDDFDRLSQREIRLMFQIIIAIQ